MLMLISSCATNGPAPVIVDTACNWVQPIYVTAGDIEVMDRQTKRAILAHNEKWAVNCNKSKSTVN